MCQSKPENNSKSNEAHPSLGNGLESAKNDTPEAKVLTPDERVCFKCGKTHSTGFNTIPDGWVCMECFNDIISGACCFGTDDGQEENHPLKGLTKTGTEHIRTFAHGLIRIGQELIYIGRVGLWMIAISIIAILPIWATIVTALDLISLGNPANTVWIPTEEFSLTDYTRRAGLVIAAGWITAFIYRCGKE